MINIVLNAFYIIIAMIVIVITASLIWCFVIPAMFLLFKSIFKLADKLSDKLFKKKKEHK